MILIIIKSNKKQGLNIIKRKQDSKKKVNRCGQSKKKRKRMGNQNRIKVVK